MSIDWSKPIEAVDAAGAVTAAKWHWRDESGDELGVRFVTCDWFGWPFRDGGQPVHKMDRVWTLRNVTTPMTDLSPETVERMVALVRRMAADTRRCFTVELEEARAIVAELPEPVDPDLVEARRIAADTGIAGFLWSQIERGMCDGNPLVVGLVAGIKRGRALAAGDRS